MKRIVFTFFSVFCIVAYGQDYISRLPASFTADTTIIRSYANEWSVVYTGNANGDNYMHLVNMNTGALYSIALDEKVTDMEILNDTLYYCGNQNMYWSILNFFPIQQFYTGTVNVKRWRVTPTMMFLPKKLEVFRVAGGVHAVVVGDIVTAVRTDSYIADFWRADISPMWDVSYLYTDDKECYDDIAVTANYVVASAQVCQSNEIILRVLDKPTYISVVAGLQMSDDIFVNCSVPAVCEYTTFHYNGTDQKKPGQHGVFPISITHTVGDHVALACMAEEGQWTGLTVKDIEVLAGTPWVVQNRCLLPADHEEAFYDVWDIQYNRDIDSLLLLVKQGGHSGKRDGIVKFDNNSFSSFSYTYPVYPEAGDKTQFLEKKEPEGKMSSFRLPANNDRNLNISTDHYVRSVALSVVAVDCGEKRSEYPVYPE